MAKLEVGTTVSFDVYPTPVLGTLFKGVKIVAIMGAALAGKLSPINERHAAVKPYVPNLPNKATSYDYVQIETKTGTDIIGIPWIIDNTIVLDQARVRKLQIASVAPGDEARILSTLALLGHPNCVFIE
jgi:hypothetical protein